MATRAAWARAQQANADLERVEMQLLLEGIYQHYGYDFRGYALASVFEGRGMEVLFAENGREGLDALQKNPDVDLVLMDIMMPEMDGYETTRAVREMPEFKSLPIVALTAKAMKGDREKSIASGASDYITKPVDVDQLLSLMRVWLYR